jgi:hypothetical protein
MLSSHRRLDLPSCLFPSGFRTKNLYTPLLSPIRATCPAIMFQIIEDFINQSQTLPTAIPPFEIMQWHEKILPEDIGPWLYLNWFSS